MPYRIKRPGSLALMDRVTILLPALMLIVFLLSGCTGFGKGAGDEDRVAWKGSRAYAKRIDAFNLKPDQALSLVLEVMKKPGAFRLRSGGIWGDATFIVGRWYWFGTATKTEIYVAGYYVNGDNGKIEYRESDKIIKSAKSHLPKQAWTKITPLPEN